jgi:hypothetical protein
MSEREFVSIQNNASMDPLKAGYYIDIHFLQRNAVQSFRLLPKQAVFVSEKLI